MPLPWMPADQARDVEDWSFSNTVSSAMQGLQQQAATLMQPMQHHIENIRPRQEPAPEASTPAMSPIKPFSLGSIQDWLGPSAPKVAQPLAQDEPSGQPGGGVSAGFSLPSISSFLGQPGSEKISPAPRSAPSYAAGSWDQRAYDAAVRAGHPDPAEFARQMRHESAGFDPDVISGKRNSPAGAQGIAQIMPATARDWGVNPLDPEAALAEAARRMTGYYQTYNGDGDKALAAYNMGPGNLAKYGPRGLPETNSYLNIIRGGAGSSAPAPARPSAPAPAARKATPAPNWGTYTPETLTPNQFTEGQQQGLSAAESIAVCGPAAAVAFARANGRNPTLAEAKQLGERLGVWDVGQGMHGPASEVQLLGGLGIDANLQQGADWGQIASEVQAGRPVIVDTPQHYFTVTGYDPSSGQFEFGQSAGVLTRSGGRTKWRPDELPGLGMGTPRATIYMGASR